MNGNVFQCHGENTEKQQFMKTVGVLEEHVNKTFTYPQDLASICKSFVITELVQPANLSKEEYEQDMGKKMIWETRMKTYMKRVDLLDLILMVSVHAEYVFITACHSLPSIPVSWSLTHSLDRTTLL